jgi:hypothetical protein
MRRDPSKADPIRNAETEIQRRIETSALWKLALYVLGVVVMSIMALGVNAGMVFGLAKALEDRLQAVPLIEPLMQYAIFVMPMLLLCLEWYVWDIIRAARRRNRI